MNILYGLHTETVFGLPKPLLIGIGILLFAIGFGTVLYGSNQASIRGPNETRYITIGGAIVALIGARVVRSAVRRRR